MALSDEQISLMAFNDDPGDWNNLAFRDCWGNGYKTGARAIEAEVHKQDEALIRQMVEAMEGVKALNMGGELALWTAEFDRLLSAITAGRARLEGKP